MLFRRIYMMGIVATLLLLASCGDGEKAPVVRSVYFWSTTFELDSAQMDFIRSNDIRKIYLRYFDVVTTPQGEVLPNATVQFVTPQPDSVEIVPTVFITNECMTHIPDDLADKILSRILQMNETRDIFGVREIQIDCDWSGRTRTAYFDMLEQLTEKAKAKGIDISTTIRLHQLSQTPPPVNRGVLMMYNTSDIKDKEHNPILDIKDVQPYMKHLKSYKLPLSTAYPMFYWDLLFRGDHFVGIMHRDDDLPVIPGDTIIHRDVPLDMVLQVKQLVDKHHPHANDEIILFDISKQNINNNKNQHYEKIYNY